MNIIATGEHKITYVTIIFTKFFTDHNKLTLANCAILFDTMAYLSQGSLERLNKIVDLGKTAFHYGFVPTILYLGFKKGAEPGMPELTLAHLFWAS